MSQVDVSSEGRGSIRDALTREAPAPACGRYADGYEPVARTFAEQLTRKEQVGAAISVYHRGRQVIDLWGGLADVATARPWKRDTRIVLFSVTKGFAAMAMHLLADRGQLRWEAPVADHVPAFSTGGKGAITVRMLLNHRAGLAKLDTPLTFAECLEGDARVREALERQVPTWAPGSRQGYHAITFGLYVAELFERIAGEPLGTFLERELFRPTGSDVRLGTPPSEDHRHASLYAPGAAERLARMAAEAKLTPNSTEARLGRELVRRDSLPRAVFSNPAMGRRGALAYNDVRARRASLAWASATGSADGVARAYLPFSRRGQLGGETWVRPETLQPVEARQSWSRCDGVLHKPVGWSQGFLKEERHLFSPNPESFGHPGMGGALGWCDPVDEVAIGYVMNHMDWRIRSPRALALCHALYDCEPLWPKR